MKGNRLLSIILSFIILIIQSSLVSAASVYDYKNSNKQPPYIDTSHMERVGYWTTEKYWTTENYTVEDYTVKWLYSDVIAVPINPNKSFTDSAREQVGNQFAGYNIVQEKTVNHSPAPDSSGGPHEYLQYAVLVKIKTTTKKTRRVQKERQVKRYRWEYKTTGFTPNMGSNGSGGSSGGSAHMIINTDAKFPFTRYHLDEKGKETEYTMDISLSPVYIDGVRATIKKWSVNHSLDRFGGHGTHYTSPYYCKLDQNGGTCIFKFDYAGDNPLLTINFIAEAYVSRTYTLDEERGTKQTIRKLVQIPCKAEIKVPVNGFNATNLHHNEKLTNDIGFKGAETHYNIGF
ncbi:hypothetical protein EXN65_06130 [Clostridium botulinum]|uniref:Uncharacterized protein n=1 Tax=Clostridium botulinum TaxID=1491 RepID=A0A846I176_CLOBO|nr:hypothetical protein [Clostridium botulinum]AXG90339.1 hypothetical protein AGE29_00565 [Clostridium botulinum]EDT84112.1 hypothetical protein CBB_A0166 [Clostridium botulinum Bf]MBY6881635.1 hypothetical protein [Clostridium botulinum]NEZ86263.1 hypothetical protein [Clostridium botulinum]NEZ93383.1 hypothetical protein [Clostridium botulinum]